MRYAAGAFNDKTPSSRVADLQFVLMSSNHRPIVMPAYRGRAPLRPHSERKMPLHHIGFVA